MRGLDDGPDGLNDAAFDRALGGGRKRTARRERQTARSARRARPDSEAVTEATEILLNAFALADAAGIKSELHLHPSVAPDAFLAWADRGERFVASEEFSRIRDGLTVRWTFYRVTLPGGSEITAHGPDREEQPIVAAVEPDALQFDPIAF